MTETTAPTRTDVFDVMDAWIDLGGRITNGIDTLTTLIEQGNDKQRLTEKLAGLKDAQHLYFSVNAEIGRSSRTMPEYMSGWRTLRADLDRKSGPLVTGEIVSNYTQGIRLGRSYMQGYGDL